LDLYTKTTTVFGEQYNSVGILPEDAWNKDAHIYINRSLI